MTNLKEQINTDINDAMRARDQKKLGVLRLITSAIKLVEVNERIVVDDGRTLAILDKMAKQRNESIQLFKTANRTDLVEQEDYELSIISHYMPAPLTDEEINQHVHDALLAVDAKQLNDMGKVMAHLKPLMQGRADMSKVSALIKAKLST
jgi:uncharacterized protein YqeY